MTASPNPPSKLATRDGYTISSNPGRLDLDAIWGFLRTAYWSPEIPRDSVARAIAGSLPFGLYAPDGAQAGFARVVSDFARFAWLGDVFVLDGHRGRGLGVWLVETILAQPGLRDLRVVLATQDAHGLYERFGFRTVTPGRFMERPRKGP